MKVGALLVVFAVFCSALVSGFEVADKKIDHIRLEVPRLSKSLTKLLNMPFYLRISFYIYFCAL